MIDWTRFIFIQFFFLKKEIITFPILTLFEDFLLLHKSESKILLFNSTVKLYGRNFIVKYCLVKFLDEIPRFDK